MNTNDSKPSRACDTLVELLRWRAAHQPDRRAYTFLVDGESEEIHLTYAELDQRARAIGAQLQQQGAMGQRALLLYPSGLDYITAFFGCLYAGVTAVPVYPPKVARLDDRSLPRLRGIVNNAQPHLALTTSFILAIAEDFLVRAPDFQTMHWLATDELASEQASEWHEPDVHGDTLAFLQYTSGSTTTPRGVMVTHDNLLYNGALIEHAFELSEDTVCVCWAPLYHDMGLIGNVLQALYSGVYCVLMSPLDFLQKPARWLQTVSRYRAVASGGPNFAYDLCARKITAEERADLDLRGWDIAYSGAEPIRAETLDRFASTFASCGFRRKVFFPCYGLAEATLFVSGGPRSAPPIIHQLQGVALEHNQALEASDEEERTTTVVGCGKTEAGREVIIVDPQTRSCCSPGQIGEVWVAAQRIPQGYWNEPEATERTFRAYLADTGAGPFLRTGDLGFMKERELVITGRLKDLIIIRGRNHAPQDIEHTAEKSHPALRLGCGIAFSVDGVRESNAGAGEQLVIVHELDRHYRDVNVEQVAGAIRQAVAENHELHVYAVVLIRAGTIPKTSSGKLQRQACRAAFLANTLEVIGVSVVEESDGDLASSTNKDHLIRTTILTAEPAQRYVILADYLQHQLAAALGVTVLQLSPDQPFTTLGLDSLKALELKNRIETDLEVEVPLVTFIEQPTLAQLTHALLERLAIADPNLIMITFGPDGKLLNDPAQVLARLEQLSDAQVDALLVQLQRQEA